jgi:predicted PurR-regulated permease PerM
MLLTVATVTAVVLGLALVWSAIEVLLLVFAGILLATVLRALADLLADYTPLSSGWSLLIVLLALLGALGGWLRKYRCK